MQAPQASTISELLAHMGRQLFVRMMVSKDRERKLADFGEVLEEV